MNKLIDNLDDLKKFNKVLLLYSGGVDSTYALLYCIKHNINVIAFRGVDSVNQTPDRIKLFLSKLGVKLVEADYTNELLESFINAGILAGGYYQNRFPISSSYTRPLIAKLATQVALNEECECIIHTSNFHQNSAARFNNAVMNYSTEIAIAIPYIKSTTTREEKLKAIEDAGFELEGSIYSIDQNIWCRVIENGELDCLKNPVQEKHFSWTIEQKIKQTDSHLAIGFKAGLPISINNELHTLKDIIKKLNATGSMFQIGRFNGLEDTPLGPKNHEVREAPAAEIIYKAKSFLESTLLTQDELKLKSNLDYRWAELVVNGNWYSLEKQSIDAAIKILNEPLNGIVNIHLSNKSAFPESINTPKALDFDSLDKEINDSKTGFSYAEYYHISTIQNKIRS
jgi:argininosuccinate synthase